MIGAGELAAKEKFSTSRLMMKVIQQKRQISTTGDRIGKGIGRMQGYRYHPWNKAIILTPIPMALDSNTLPPRPWVKGRTTNDNSKGGGDGSMGLMKVTAVERCPRSPY